MFQPEIKASDPMTVAFARKTGPYSQIPEGYGQLYGWIAMHGLTPSHDGMPMAVYLTHPDEVPEAEALWELWAPLAGDPSPLEPDADGLGVKHIDAGIVAAAMHHGTYETLGSTYGQLAGWVASQGYHMAGPPYETYLTGPDTPPEEHRTEVCFPVVKD